MRIGLLTHEGVPRAVISRTAVLLFAALVLLFASPASGHVPGLEPQAEDGPAPIGGPEASRATYGYLAPGEDYDEYEFTAHDSVVRAVGIIVPAYPEHADFRPTLVVIPEDKEPLEISDPAEEPRPREFEPFSLMHFWPGGEREISFESGTRYTLRVEPGPGDASGRYVVVFGGPERFEADDVVGTFRRLPAIWFATYGDAPFRWNWLALIPIAVSAALVAAIVLGVAKLVAGRASVTRR